MAADPGSLGLDQVVKLKKKLSEGKFRPYLKRCLMVPAPFNELGLVIIHTKKRKTLVRDVNRDKVVQLDMGIFNLFFLMDWVEYSLGQDVDQMKPLQVNQGKLEVGEKYVLNIPLARDEEMFGDLYDLYRSNNRAQMPNQAPLWKCSQAKGEDPDLYIRYSGCQMWVDLPDCTGYWKVAFDLRHLIAGMVSLFVWTLKDQGFSYRFESSRKTLYFSNSIGASLGLPPTAEHLGMEELELRGDMTRKGLLAAMITSVLNWDEEVSEEEETDRGSEIDFVLIRDPESANSVSAEY
jgi:hypothetical protein